MRHVETRPGLYRDSVALMQISTALSRLPVVDAALVAMGTEVNLDLLEQMGFEAPSGVGPTDMVVALATRPEADADDPHPMAGVLARLEAELSAPTTTASTSLPTVEVS